MRYAIPLLLILTSCNSVINPLTTVPALVLGAYDSVYKRDQWKRYADQGDVYAMFELGHSYCCTSTEGKRDYLESLKWYCAAASKGYAKAQVKLAKYYEGRETLGDLTIAKDDARALMWYELASRRANNEAMDLRRALKKRMSQAALQDGDYLLTHHKEVPCDHQPLEWNE